MNPSGSDVTFSSLSRQYKRNLVRLIDSVWKVRSSVGACEATVTAIAAADNATCPAGSGVAHHRHLPTDSLTPRTAPITRTRGAYQRANEIQGRPPPCENNSGRAPPCEQSSGAPTNFRFSITNTPAVVWVGYIWLFWWAWSVYGVEDFTLSGDVTLTCRIQPWRFRRCYRNGDADGILSYWRYSAARTTVYHNTQRGLHHPRRLASRHVSSTRGGAGAKTRSTAPRVRRRRRVQLTRPRPHRTIRTQSVVLVHGDRAALSPSPPSPSPKYSVGTGGLCDPFLVPLHVPTPSIEPWELHHANQYNSCTAFSSSIHHQSLTLSTNHPY